MKKRETKKQTSEKPAPTIAPGMENDELDANATPEEIEKDDYTLVTKLYRDWI